MALLLVKCWLYIVTNLGGPKRRSYSPDMDQNGLISRQDLYEVMDLITDTQLSDEQKAKIVNEVRK